MLRDVKCVFLQVIHHKKTKYIPNYYWNTLLKVNRQWNWRRKKLRLLWDRALYPQPEVWFNFHTNKQATSFPELFCRGSPTEFLRCPKVSITLKSICCLQFLRLGKGWAKWVRKARRGKHTGEKSACPPGLSRAWVFDPLSETTHYTISSWEICALYLKAQEVDSGNSNLSTIPLSYFACHRSYGHITTWFYCLFVFSFFFK